MAHDKLCILDGLIITYDSMVIYGIKKYLFHYKHSRW